MNTLHNRINKKVLAVAYPNRDMSATTKVTHENDCYNVANFVRACNEAGQAGRDFKPFFNCGNHRIDIARAQGLLQRHEK